MSTAIDALRGALSGAVVAPGDAGWDQARQAWNLAIDQRPAAVAFAESADDVAAAVAIARREGLRVAPQATGHGASTVGPLEGALLLRTDRMRGIEIDAGARCARVQAGAWWGDVALAAGEHGLAGLAGSATDVGVVGYTLGGGLGWLGRRHGLACNSVLAVELVTADGARVRADADHEPELFWALRGGGGGLGAITAMELELYPVPEVFAGMFVWEAGHGEQVLEAYRDWARSAPDEITSIVRFLNVPPLPAIPKPLRGRSVVAVDGAFLGTVADGEQLIAPLRAIAPTLIDDWRAMPAAALRSLHGDPEQPTPGAGDGCLVRELTPRAAAAFVAAAGPDSGSPLIGAELRHLGGALATVPEGAGALGSLAGEYALYCVGPAPDAGAAQRTMAHVKVVLDALEPWLSDRRFLNFGDRVGDAAAAFAPADYERLRAVKSSYDPDGLFQSQHDIAPR